MTRNVFLFLAVVFVGVTPIVGQQQQATIDVYKSATCGC